MTFLPNYTVGAGRVFLSTDSVETGERYLGSSSGFSFAPSVETLETFRSRQGVLVKDGSHLTRFSASAGLQLDDISSENLKLYMIDQTPIQVRAIDSRTVSLKLWPGNIYFTGDFDIRGLTATYEGELYDLSQFVIDHEMGSLEVPLDADIYEGQDISLSFTCDSVTVPSGERKLKPFVGSLRYIENNLAGRSRILFMPEVTLLPDSEIDLKASSWRTLGLRAEITSVPVWLDREQVNDYAIGDGIEDFGGASPTTSVLDDDYGVL